MKVTGGIDIKLDDWCSMMALRALLLLAWVTILGCSDGADGRIEMSGKVTLDGQSLAQGNITFVSTDGGSSSGTKIREGAFHLPTARGLSPGKYRVKIVSYQPTGKQVPDSDDPSQMVEETRQVIPSRYNRSTELTFEITVEKNDALLFEMHSQKQNQS